jgi:hypothetical protein
LERLTAAEQISVLTEHHIQNPEAFLQEAIGRGLNDLLTNPHNLLMLAEVVAKKDWPRTRGELFKSAKAVDEAEQRLRDPTCRYFNVCFSICENSRMLSIRP